MLVGEGGESEAGHLVVVVLASEVHFEDLAADDVAVVENRLA
jgi:hypothetical protein